MLFCTAAALQHAPRPALMLQFALLMGLSMDMFMNIMGISHAAACVFIAYLRPFIINMPSPASGFEASLKKLYDQHIEETNLDR